MKILIVEDEHHAQKRLSKIIKSIRPKAEIIDIIDSVEDTIDFLKNNKKPDLLFLDIQLSDGLSFEIFQEIKIDVPVIFTTAFDEYAIQAFKLNSVDYLLKPVEEVELEKAIEKYEKLFSLNDSATDFQHIQQLVQSLAPKKYQQRFLLKTGQQINFINTNDIAYFFSDNSLSFIMTKNKNKYIVEHTMDHLEQLVDPSHFFRVSRKTIVNIDGILKANSYFNSRLVLTLNPPADFQVIVSREKVKLFKNWLGA